MTARAWAALTTVYVVWGSTYLAIMVAIRTLPPLLMSSARFLVAGGSVYARGAALPRDLLLGSSMQMLSAGVLLAAAGLGSGEAHQVRSVSAASLGAVAYLVVVGSIVTYSAYVWLLKSAPISIVSTYAFVNPAIAVALGAVFLGEPLGLRTFAAGAAIIMSVALIVTGREGRAPAPVRAPEPLPEPLRQAA